MNNTIRPRRLFVSGASQLSENAAALWRELGRLLAHKNGPVVITGGLGDLQDEPGSLTADKMIIDGMVPELRKQGIRLDKRIETFLPDENRDPHREFRFRTGRIVAFTNRNAQSRRFSMVHSADVVIAIEGETGTRSVLDVALAIGRPVLPLPFEGNRRKTDTPKVLASKAAWIAEREDILKWFCIEPSEAEYFEQVRLDELNADEIQELAGCVHGCLLRGFTQCCFVIMRIGGEAEPVFEQAIEPALVNCGYKPWRTNRAVPAGDLVAMIHDGINHCYFVIVDTSGDRPNVMYELGLAHAARKPVILLRRLNADGSLPDPPFDFGTHSILGYTDNLDELRRRLQDAIPIVCDKLQTMGPD